MIVLLIPFFFIELYLSLKTGESIGFLWSVVWIMVSFMFGMFLLKKSPQTIIENMQSVKQGKLNNERFRNANLSYFMGAILLIIPGVFSDLLGVILFFYTLYLQFVAKITPEQTNFYEKQGDDNVIDVEIIDEYSRSNRNP